MTAEPVVFLDRDGTLNVKAPEDDYITAPERLELLPGVREAVAELHEAGCALVVVTNQRGVARGRMTEAGLDAVNQRLRDALGTPLTAIYSCPHDHGECDCRKPQPGLLLQAFAEHPELDRSRAVIVGDADSDLEAGRRAGVATVALAPLAAGAGADHRAPDLASAVPWILAHLQP